MSWLEHSLENFMCTISKNAFLSKIYTNHCICSTVITSLDAFGFEARHITAVSGHKSENTIKSYSTKCPDVKKREMSDVLSSILGEKTNIPNPAKPTAATISKPPPQSANTGNVFPTINSHDIVDWIPIENNSHDFDLARILDEFEQTTKTSTEMTTVTKDIKADVAAESNASPVPSTLVQNFTASASNMQNHPFVPKMFFQNSSVTINYNFNSKN